MTTSLILMALLAISIGIATLIEKEVGTESAQHLIYHAH
jgi:hypothetical protein